VSCTRPPLLDLHSRPGPTTATDLVRHAQELAGCLLAAPKALQGVLGDPKSLPLTVACIMRLLSGMNLLLKLQPVGAPDDHGVRLCTCVHDLASPLFMGCITVSAALRGPSMKPRASGVTSAAPSPAYPPPPRTHTGACSSPRQLELAKSFSTVSMLTTAVAAMPTPEDLALACEQSRPTLGFPVDSVRTLEASAGAALVQL
jgi:hypothetical protein